MDHTGRPGTGPTEDGWAQGGDRPRPRQPVVRPAIRVPGPPPSVPGLEVTRLLGCGAHGDVWAAVDAQGRRWAVKVAAGTDGGSHLQREAALLLRLRHEHLVTVHELVECADGRPAAVLDLAAGGSLADLVARCGRLAAAELVTVLVPVAQALAFLHARGVVHADVAPANVLLHEDGRPVLADLGVVAAAAGAVAGHGRAGFVAPETAEGAPATPAADVWALGRLGAWALRDDGTPEATAVADVLRAMTASTASDRPDARAAAAALWRAAPARPLPAGGPGRVGVGAVDPVAVAVTERLAPRVRPAPAAVPTQAGGSVAARWAAAGAVALGVCAAVAALAVLVPADPGSGTGGPVPRAGAGQAAGASDDQRRPRPSTGAATRLTADVALVELGRRRASALEARDLAGLAAVEAAGSPVGAADAQLLRALAARSLRLEGLAWTWSDVSVVRTSPGRAVVAATVTTTAHRRVDASGAVVAAVPATAPQRVSVTLVEAPGAPGWQVLQVQPAA